MKSDSNFIDKIYRKIGLVGDRMGSFLQDVIMLGGLFSCLTTAVLLEDWFRDVIPLAFVYAVLVAPILYFVREAKIASRVAILIINAIFACFLAPGFARPGGLSAYIPFMIFNVLVVVVASIQIRAVIKQRKTNEMH